MSLVNNKRLSLLNLPRLRIQFFTQGRFYVGAGWHVPPSPDSLVAPSQIQKLDDRSDVISDVQKCSKIRKCATPYEASLTPPLTPLEELTVLPKP